MSVLKLLSPAYWYLLAAKLGLRLVLVLAGLVAFGVVALQAGAIGSSLSSTAEGLVRSFFGV